MPLSHDPETVVQSLFHAFRDGDIEGLLATLHDDVSLTYVGANPSIVASPSPVKAVLIGREKARRFFAGIYDRLEMSSFEAHETLVTDQTVVVFGSEVGVVKATSEPFRNEWVQKYDVREGLIESLVEYNVEIPPRRADDPSDTP